MLAAQPCAPEVQVIAEEICEEPTRLHVLFVVDSVYFNRKAKGVHH
jgi:hypothetical protein